MNKYRVFFKSGFSIVVKACDTYEASAKACFLTGLLNKDICHVTYMTE